MNKALWNSVSKTDPRQVKAITGKQYQGSSPKPYYIVERATETFGPCGIGWGVRVINERFERLSDEDVLHVALIEVWYMHEGKTGSIQQMGQTKAAYKTSKGTLLVDEDAPKKSVTDGMVKCLSLIGFAGDIFGGRWDDSKYQSVVLAELLEKENPVITEEQFVELNAALDETLSDKEKFCENFKIKSLKELSQSDYEKANTLLDSKRRKMGANNAKS
jgi:hypothetical protein